LSGEKGGRWGEGGREGVRKEEFPSSYISKKRGERKKKKRGGGKERITAKSRCLVLQKEEDKRGWGEKKGEEEPQQPHHTPSLRNNKRGEEEGEKKGGKAPVGPLLILTQSLSGGLDERGECGCGAIENEKRRGKCDVFTESCIGGRI